MPIVLIMSSIQSDDSTAGCVAAPASFDSLPEEVARIVLGCGSCCSFATPEPITRYFASIDGMNSSHSQTMLSSTNAYFFKTSDDKLVVAYAPRDTFRRSRSEGRLGETTWELLGAWNHPGAKFLETLTKHPTARWSFCA